MECRKSESQSCHSRKREAFVTAEVRRRRKGMSAEERRSDILQSKKMEYQRLTIEQKKEIARRSSERRRLDPQARQKGTEYSRRWRARQSLEVLANIGIRERARKYKMTPDQLKMFLGQGCFAKHLGATNCAGILVVDHDHDCCPEGRTCGRCIRGVLCTRRNVIEGAFQRNRSWIEAYQTKEYI